MQVQKQKSVCVSPIKAQTILRQVLSSVSPLEDLWGTARAWMPSIKLILQSCSSIQSSFCNSDLSSQTHQLLAATIQYQKSLHEHDFIDESELYWRAIDLAPVSRQQLLVYGYFQPQAGELAWINALAAPDSIIFLPLDDAPLFRKTQAGIDWLIQAGWERLDDQVTTPPTVLLGTPANASLCKTFLSNENSEPPAKSTVAHSYGTFDAEIRGTLSKVKALRSAGIAEKDIAIVARDERSYGPKLLDIAWEYDLPLRALYATPLLTTRLGAWLALLLRVIETQFPFEETAKLLSHPLCSNPDSNFWGAARQIHPEGFIAWREIAADQLALNISSLERVRQTRRRDSWVEWLMAVFKTFSLRSRCARWPRENVAFNNLEKALVEVSKPENEQLSWLMFKQQMEELLESVTVPAQPGRGGVELHSPASMIGAQYAHLFVVGMADGILPPIVSSDPVLDFFERAHLSNQGIHLSSPTDNFQKEALDFYRTYALTE